MDVCTRHVADQTNKRRNTGTIDIKIMKHILMIVDNEDSTRLLRVRN